MYPIASKTFEHEGDFYFADKSYVPSIGPETMIFSSDSEGNVTDWTDLYCDRTDKSLDECIKEFKQTL